MGKSTINGHFPKLFWHKLYGWRLFRRWYLGRTPLLTLKKGFPSCIFRWCFWFSVSWQSLRCHVPLLAAKLATEELKPAPGLSQNSPLFTVLRLFVLCAKILYIATIIIIFVICISGRFLMFHDLSLRVLQATKQTNKRGYPSCEWITVAQRHTQRGSNSCHLITSSFPRHSIGKDLCIHLHLTVLN